MLYLVHHGHAVGPGEDSMRPLSECGRGAVERLAEEARARGAKPDVIWHSGKLRARQTAEAFWRACNPLAAFGAARGLQPDDPPSWMRDQLAGSAGSIMVVGHMPHLPALLHLLCGEAADPPGFDFPLHGCVALEADGAGWKEVWRITP
jgi:phosphohistidine phosphatase